MPGTVWCNTVFRRENSKGVITTQNWLLLHDRYLITALRFILTTNVNGYQLCLLQEILLQLAPHWWLKLGQYPVYNGYVHCRCSMGVHHGTLNGALFGEVTSNRRETLNLPCSPLFCYDTNFGDRPLDALHFQQKLVGNIDVKSWNSVFTTRFRNFSL